MIVSGIQTKPLGTQHSQIQPGHVRDIVKKLNAASQTQAMPQSAPAAKTKPVPAPRRKKTEAPEYSRPLSRQQRLDTAIIALGKIRIGNEFATIDNVNALVTQFSERVATEQRSMPVGTKITRLVHARLLLNSIDLRLDSVLKLFPPTPADHGDQSSITRARSNIAEQQFGIEKRLQTLQKRAAAMC